MKIRLRAIDQEGNHSEEVNIELISKERKYEIQENLLGEATFKCPHDPEGLVTVLKSVISFGVKKNLVSTEKAQSLNDALEKMNEASIKEDGAGNGGK